MAVTPKLDREDSALLTRVMILGAQTALPVELSGTELMRLIGVIYRDTDNTEKLPSQIASKIVPDADYYEIEGDWFSERFSLTEHDHVSLFLAAKRDIPDFITYLRCLSELHKRRLKYLRILKAQPIPKMIQISPRALLEYGGMDVEALGSWMTWRKWFFDLDNRSGQESGYLFEPILANALGGEPASAKHSPIRRTADKNQRRQVDCVIVKADGTKLAYEFKLRVTIAASGQGRFSEETDFAIDCRNSGYQPVLVVLDPTPNHRLSDLEAAFRDAGGFAYTGDAAWEHLEQEAGATMARFIERYVRKPIREVSAYEGKLRDFAAKRRADGNIELLIGDVAKLILRDEDVSLESGGSTGEE